jgi:hypothetical protein
LRHIVVIGQSHDTLKSRHSWAFSKAGKFWTEQCLRAAGKSFQALQTRYEKVRLLSSHALCLSQNAMKSGPREAPSIPVSHRSRVPIHRRTTPSSFEVTKTVNRLTAVILIFSKMKIHLGNRNNNSEDSLNNEVQDEDKEK